MSEVAEGDDARQRNGTLLQYFQRDHAIVSGFTLPENEGRCENAGKHQEKDDSPVRPCMDCSGPLQRQHQSQRHGYADTETDPIDFLEDVLVREVCVVCLAEMADAEEDNHDPQRAAWNDDVETDPPRRIVRNSSTEEGAHSESYALNAAGDGAEDRTILQ